MIKIHSSPNAIDVHNMQHLLAQSGIDTEIRGENLGSALGEIPVTEAWAELWLIDDAQEAEARSLLAAAQEPSRGSWTCSGCGESVDAGFAQCWKCQAPAPDQAES